MKTFLFGCAMVATFAGVSAMAADAPAPGISRLLDNEIRQVESEVVSLAEAMPADKYKFAPTAGAFDGARTFSQQMTHIAAVA